MDLLKKFHLDFQVRTAVKEALFEHLKDIAWKRSVMGEDMSSMKESKEAIDSFFRELDRTYTVKQKRIIKSNK